MYPSCRDLQDVRREIDHVAGVVHRGELGGGDQDHVVAHLEGGEHTIVEGQAKIEDYVFELWREHLHGPQQQVRRDQVGLLRPKRGGEDHEPGGMGEDRAPGEGVEGRFRRQGDSGEAG